MTRLRAAALVALLALTGAVPGRSAAPPGTTVREVQLLPAGSAAPRRIELWWRGGTGYISTHDLSLLLDATKEWRPDLGRLVLLAGSTRWTVMEGSDLAVVGKEHVVHLSGPVFLWDGVLHVPLDLIVNEEGLPQSWAPPGIRLSEDGSQLSAATRQGAVREARIETHAGGATLVVATDRDVNARLVRAEATFFVVRLPGVTYDPLLHPIPADDPLFQGLAIANRGDGVEVAFTPGTQAVGYRFTTPDARRVEIILGADEEELRVGRLLAFQSPRALVPEEVRRVVLDPGHGGSDAGASLEGSTEAELALDLCQRAARVLYETLGIESSLTRASESRTGAERAQRVAEVQGDVLLSVHIHSGAKGVRGYVGDSDRPGSSSGPGYLNLGLGASEGDPGAQVAGSRLLARFLVGSAAQSLGIPDGSVQAASLAELERAGVPAALVEISLGRSGWDEAARDAAAAALVEGLHRYMVAGGAEW